VTPALSWLYSTQLFGIKLGLENVNRLLAALDHPERDLKFIHVAGTNGKGSTCAFIHALLRVAGCRAGLFTSPHLVRFNERICDQERQINDAELEAGLEKLRALVAGWDPHPTFFELAFALALDWFRARGLEWVVLETGLGGRLDATNAVLPEVCVITRIGMDHMEQLGETLPQIAAEKAGIIKPGVPVVTGLQDPAALAVLRQTASERKSPLVLLDGPVEGVPLGLAGPHQAWNAALALEAVREAGIRLPAIELERALISVNWPGRFQRLRDDSIILDGAHNPESALVLAGTWQLQFPREKAAIIFAAARDKDVVGIMEPLAAIAASWHLTSFHSSRAMPVEELQKHLLSLETPPHPTKIFTYPDVELALAGPTSCRKLVCGSLYLVGEALALLENGRHQHQPSQQ
jgi:dihydrofolate synthase/folylpolyglutamate synthase